MKHEKSRKPKSSAVDHEEGRSVPRALPEMGLDPILRVLGTIAGLAGLVAGLDWLFGYWFYMASWDAMHIPRSLLPSVANENYIYMGYVPFVNLVMDTLLGLSTYYVAVVTGRLCADNIFILINRYFSSLTPTFITGLVSVLVGLILFFKGIFNNQVLSVGSNLFDQPIIFLAVFLLFWGIEILLLTDVSPYISDDFQNTKYDLFELSNKFFAFLKFAFIVFLSTVLVGAQLLLAFRNGYTSGCNSIAKSPTSITLYSEGPIALEGESKNEELYVYRDYYLLFADNNEYYLFREVDPNTLKPKSLIIVSKGSIKSVEMNNIVAPANWNLSKECVAPF